MATFAPARRTRIFLDSSAVIAAAISSSGSALDLINLGLDGQVERVVSSLVLTESERNIARKAARAFSVYRLISDALQRRVVDPTPDLVRLVARFVEPKDAAIVAAALAAEAPFLASYDRKHLLGQASAIQTAFHITVATPAQIITWLRNLP
jgi:predicted nucleic acid-binding protein